MLVFLNKLNSYCDTRLITALDCADNRFHDWINPRNAAFGMLSRSEVLIERCANLLSVASVTLEDRISRPPTRAVVIANLHLLTIIMPVSVVFTSQSCCHAGVSPHFGPAFARERRPGIEVRKEFLQTEVQNRSGMRKTRRAGSERNVSGW